MLRGWIDRLLFKLTGESDIPTPNSGYVRIYVDVADGAVRIKDEADMTVPLIRGSNNVSANDAIARYDGTSGTIIDTSLAKVDDDGNILARTLVVPTLDDTTVDTPAADNIAIFIDEADGDLKGKLDDGSVVVYSGGGGSYTDEEAQDAVGTILVDSTTIDFTYNDGTPSITADVKATSIDTAHIAGDAVTYAKMQNVSATDKLLGRSSSGAGDVEEITCTAAGRAILDDATAADQRTTLGIGELGTKTQAYVLIRTLGS